jgi:hypothetical protein
MNYPLAFLLRFFAGFCLIANGAYLASAAILPVGDAEELLRTGAPLWALVWPGSAAVVVGVLLWRGLRVEFGIASQAVDRRALHVVSMALAVLIGFMLFWSSVT